MIEQLETLTDHRPLTVGPALDTFRACLAREGNQWGKLSTFLDGLATHAALTNTVTGFELVVNASLDHGYRGEGLLAFVFTAMNRRFAARVQRRLKHSVLGARASDVEDLVMTTIEGVHRLFERSDRVEHSVTYALLLSIADHRAIDFLRRKRADLVECVDSKVESQKSELTNRWRPDRELEKRQGNELVRTIRGVILDAVNKLNPLQREALILVEVEGVGYHEVARRLDMKSTDVGNFVRRARKMRDRNFVAGMRANEAIDGHIGFVALQANRELRTNLLRWAAEIGDGFCYRCLQDHKYLHTADQPCVGESQTVRGLAAAVNTVYGSHGQRGIGR